MRIHYSSMLPDTTKDEARQEIQLLFHLLGQHQAKGLQEAVKAGKAGLQNDDSDQVRISLDQIQGILKDWSLHPALSNQLTKASEAASLVEGPMRDAARDTGRTFSFRAESPLDVQRFLAAAEQSGIEMTISQHPDATLPDVEVELTAAYADLMQLQEILMTVEDSQVMLETLRESPLAENSLERAEPHQNRAPAMSHQGPSM